MSPTGRPSSTSEFFAGAAVEPPSLKGLCFWPAGVVPIMPPRSLGGSMCRVRPPSATLSALKSGGPDFWGRSGPRWLVIPALLPASELPTAPLLPSGENGLDLPSAFMGVLLELESTGNPGSQASDLERLVSVLRSGPGDRGLVDRPAPIVGGRARQPPDLPVRSHHLRAGLGERDALVVGPLLRGPGALRLLRRRLADVAPRGRGEVERLAGHRAYGCSVTESPAAAPVEPVPSVAVASPAVVTSEKVAAVPGTRPVTSSEMEPLKGGAPAAPV